MKNYTNRHQELGKRLKDTKYLNLKILAIVFSCFNLTFATDYHIGPGQTYNELGDIPWLTLQSGDHVFIHWRSNPYAEKLFIRVRGTEQNPIIISGVPNANGDLPVISGENATTPTQFAGYFSSQWTEDLALILISRNENVPPEDNYTYKPGYLIFEYLELTGAYKDNTFTDQFGNVRNYNPFCSAIHALISDNLTIRHCKIHDNGQAIFTNSYGSEEGEISRNTLIEYNRIWNNGGPEDDFTHNIYIQSAGSIIQYNYFGQPRQGSLCANIKDRSSRTIIRYNWIDAAAYLLDLVETEDAQDIIMNEPNYHDVYVYGNIFLNNVSSNIFAASLIHFGYDNSPDLAKRGTLYFFNNTVFIQGDENDWWNTTLFFINDDQNPSTTEASVDMYNNIIAKEGTTHLQLMRDGGTLNIYANNWLQNDFEEISDGATAQVNNITSPITGTSPGFADPSNQDFHLISSSPCIDMSGPLPTNITSNYPLDKQYIQHANVEDRNTVGNAMDLGAFEYDSSLGINSDNYFDSLVIFPNPVKNILYLKSEKNISQYEIFNILGQKISSHKLKNNKIGVSKLPKGTYYLKAIIDKNNTKTLKFIKQ